MEEEIPVRYTFVMLLAISDPSGLVVGTDVALARRFNMPLAQFQHCIEVLGTPDPDSNSKELDGRRVVPSDGERGYQIVNFVKYKLLKDESERREYMREYMRKYRNPNSVNSGKLSLTSPSVSSSTSASPKEGSAEGGESLKEFAGHLKTPRVMAKWQVWMTHRRAYKKPKSWLLLFNEQIEWLGRFTEAEVFEILSASIRNGWMGLFEPRNGHDTQTSNQAKPMATRPQSVFDLREIIKVKEERAARIRTAYCSDCAAGESWSDQKQRQDYFALKKEVRTLKQRIESFA